MTPERERTIRVALARAWQAQSLADQWRREAGKRRDLLRKMLGEARDASPDVTTWPDDVAALAAVEQEIDE